MKKNIRYNALRVEMEIYAYIKSYLNLESLFHRLMLQKVEFCLEWLFLVVLYSVMQSGGNSFKIF